MVSSEKHPELRLIRLIQHYLVNGTLHRHGACLCCLDYVTQQSLTEMITMLCLPSNESLLNSSGVARPGQARALPGNQVTLPYHQLPRVLKEVG